MVEHTFKEGNHATEFLASMSYNYSFGSHIVSVSAPNFRYFIYYDCMDIIEPV
ncbi:hypothetical protein LINPERHAP1_LOCUS26212 [Linum perenne]